MNAAAAQDCAAWCAARWEEAEARRRDDPEVNPVKELAVALSRRLEAGDTQVEDLAAAIELLSNDAAEARARRLRAYALETAADAEDRLDRVFAAAAARGGADFAELVERPRAGVVFTAHPTFGMSDAMAEAIARFASATAEGEAEARAAIDAAPHLREGGITLDDEHVQATAALDRARAALDDLHERVRAAAEEAGLDWRAVTPRLASLATWVGYDIDGRSDIAWSASLQFRLDEKAAALARARDAMSAVADLCPDADPGAAAVTRAHDRIAAAAACAEEDAAAFQGDLSTPEALADAANRLTAADERRMVGSNAVLEALSAALDAVEDAATARTLWRLRAEVAATGLGVGDIHLRVNAAQIHNAARAELGLDPEEAGFGRTAREAVAERIAGAAPVKINFASVAYERATARRHFMLTAQILKHVEADRPVRFLIAESESPVTVLAALYLAKLYGVVDTVDISPLFETPDALERGGRLMEQLLDEPEYLAYVRGRGRLAIQLGWSDSGRFMGQIAAGFAAERLQILLARALAARGVTGVEVVIFNTHGESMGRGAHPDSMADRMAWILTPQARAAFKRATCPLVHETSFQGGDGFLHFRTPELARASVAHIAADALDPPPQAEDDPFYDDIAFTWDVYRALKEDQEDLYENADYQAVLSGFPGRLLPPSGSRKTRRRSEAGSVEGLRGVRAIPHNAMLQQIGAPLNVAGSLRAASRIDRDRFADLVTSSPRFARAFALIAASRLRASVPALRAYATVFDPTYWTGRAYGGVEPKLHAPAEFLAARLAAQRRYGAIARLANAAMADFAAFDEIAVPPEDGGALADARKRLQILHAVRAALMMRASLLAARAPVFSPRNDVTKDDVVDYVLDLDVEEAVAALRDAFPSGGDARQASALMDEPADAGPTEIGYGPLHRRIVEPLERAFGLIRAVSVAVAHDHGAHG